MGSKRLVQGLNPNFLLVSTKKLPNLRPFFLKLMGSETQGSKFDGFPGTHGTHTNGATAIVACPQLFSVTVGKIKNLLIIYVSIKDHLLSEITWLLGSIHKTQRLFFIRPHLAKGSFTNDINPIFYHLPLSTSVIKKKCKSQQIVLFFTPSY